MSIARVTSGRVWTADEFLAAGRHDFGNAWHPELRAAAHAAPPPGDIA